MVHYNTDLKIGSGTPFESHYPNIGDFFDGTIDEVLIYNKALTPNEISTIYSSYFIPSNLEVPLYPGWNFISTPKTLASGYNTGSIFANVDMGGHSAYMWDGSPSPGHWNTLQANTPILPLYGVWVYSTSNAVVNLNFDTTNPTSIPAPRSLPEGWNTIGFTGLNPTSARNTYLSVQPSWVNSMGFNANTQSYESTIFNGDSSESTLLFPTKGYWLYMRSPGSLTAIGTSQTPTVTPTFTPTPTQTASPTPTPTQTQIQWKTYSNYGFSFNYPEGMIIVLSGLNGQDANWNGGIVSVRNQHDVITIVWAKTNGQPTNLDEVYLNEFKKLQNNPDYTDVSFGNIEKKSHLGHTVSTISAVYKFAASNQLYSAQASWWYCPQSDRSYYISIDTQNDSIYAKDTLAAYLDSFICH
jgi:hypothetical protein